MYTVYTAYMCVIIIYNMYICIYSMYREPVWELIGRGGIENGNTNNKENIYILYFSFYHSPKCIYPSLLLRAMLGIQKRKEKDHSFSWKMVDTVT